MATKQAQYENQGGLLVLSGTNQCAGYIFNFADHGAFQPDGKVETAQGPAQAEIDVHNAILAKAELDHASEVGKATFYLSWDQGQGGTQSNYRVSNWVGSWKSPHCYVRRGYSYGFGRFETFWIWFTGPDGKQWYGVLKGDMQCFNARRLKQQGK